MRDQQSLERCQKLHPKVRQEAIEAIEEAEAGFPSNMKVRVVQGVRTIEEQNELYAQGRTKPGKIITKAIGGKSYHNFSVALDFAIMYDKDYNGSFEELSWDIAKDGDKDGIKDWDEVIAAFEKRGWESGSKWRTFKDYPHVQRSFGFKVSELLAKYNAGDFIPGTQYLNI
jgi:peptidoglycan LD-endopeptidase CwlK